MSLLLSARLQALRSGYPNTHLSFIPQTLTIAEVVQLILLLVFRQLLYFIGLGKDGRVDARKGGNPFIIPEIHLSMPFRLTSEDLRQYALAVGLNQVDSIWNDSAQICLMLSAFSEPAALLLLASRGCPIRPLGSVNVRNRFEILVPRSCTSEILLEMTDAEIRARVSRDTRPVKRGLEIDLQVEIVAGHEKVVIFRQVITILQFMKFKRPPAMPAKASTRDDNQPDWSEALTTIFNMNINAPLAWARICKDYNLLHVSTWAARLLGFPGRIAHGNHALALGIARLNGEAEYQEELRSRQFEFKAMEVQFRKPMVLPAIMSVQMLASGKSIDFAIIKDGKHCATACHFGRDDDKS